MIVFILDLSAINAVVVLELCQFNNFSGFPHLKNWMEKMKKLPYYEECVAGPSREVTALYQEKLKKLSA